MSRRKRLWFLEARNSHTNAVFASELDQNESALLRKTSDGREVEVWQCSESQRNFFMQSRSAANLEFNVLTCLEDDHRLRYPSLKNLGVPDQAKYISGGTKHHMISNLIGEVAKKLLEEARKLEKRVEKLKNRQGHGQSPNDASRPRHPRRS